MFIKSLLDRHRATHIFVCDTPDGEFVPLTDKPITPPDWECLDGTFWIENGKPYIIFSHEWTQVKNGEIWAMQLSEDLKSAVDEPFLLFRASDNPNVSELNGHLGAYVTDGPFLYREDGKVNMIWSSFYQGRYNESVRRMSTVLCHKFLWQHHGNQKSDSQWVMDNTDIPNDLAKIL